MDKIKCLICGKDFQSDGSFHRHLKAHKLTQTAYYHKNFPRHDLYDGEIIRYKNKTFYFESDFNNRTNFKNWLKANTPETVRKYVIEFLRKRKDKKGLVYGPTQVEIKTLNLPGIKYMNESLGGYESICKEVGLIPRFVEYKFNLSALKDVSKKVIFTDTREQNPLHFSQQTRNKGLKFGDYRMAGSSVYIERKSIGDAWGTLTGGYDRFDREIQRAKDANAYLVILVEGPTTELESFPFQRQVYGKIKIPVEFVYHSIRELMQKYQHIQFLFVKDRDEASRVIPKLFSADEQVRKVDLQLLYDKGNL